MLGVFKAHVDKQWLLNSKRKCSEILWWQIQRKFYSSHWRSD